MTTATATPEPAGPPIDVDALLADLLAPKIALIDIARKHAMSLERLAQWARRPQIASLLEDLRHLADLRAGLITAERRTGAVAALAEIASADDANREPARKAATTLARLDPAPPVEDPVDLPPSDPQSACEDPPPDHAPGSRDIDAEIRALAEFVNNPNPSARDIERIAPFLAPHPDETAQARDSHMRAPPD